MKSRDCVDRSLGCHDAVGVYFHLCKLLSLEYHTLKEASIGSSTSEVLECHEPQAICDAGDSE